MEYPRRINSSKDELYRMKKMNSQKTVLLICDEIYKKIGIRQDDSVLELGCGSGILGNWIKNRCRLYVGTDLSLQMLNIFLKSDIKMKSNLIQGITDMVPFMNNVFDVVILNGVTMYFHNDKTLERTLTEMKRLSKTNGTIFLGENITSAGSPWEFTWFQDLPPLGKIFAKLYIKIRKGLAKRIPRLAGKWKFVYREISPKIINKVFDNAEFINESMAATLKIKYQIFGNQYKGNRRTDFVIKLK